MPSVSKETLKRLKEAMKKQANRKPAELQEVVEKATKRIKKARVRLIMGNDANAFFSSLAMNLSIRATFDIPTMATDGHSLYYNPDFTNELSDDTVLGVVIHEVMHCVMNHFIRVGTRDKKLWNIAADLAINQLIVSCGFKLPEQGCHVGHGMFAKFPLNKCAEEYYRILTSKEELKKMGINSDDLEDSDEDVICVGQGKPKSDGDGKEGKGITKDEVRELRELAEKWQDNVSKAAHECKKRGTEMGGLQRLINELTKPKIDWRHTLREFVTQRTKNGQTWRRPNKKYHHMGIYLPAMEAHDEIGTIAISVDSSGSISTEDLTEFFSEINGIANEYKCKMYIMPHHTHVYDIVEHDSSDGEVIKPKRVESGGTSHQDVFEKVRDLPEPAVCFISITDLYSDIKEEDEHGLPPTLFVCPNEQVAPFGRTVQMID